MKKILLAVTTALAITGCSQNEEFDAPNQQTKIDFTSVVRKLQELQIQLVIIF